MFQFLKSKKVFIAGCGRFGSLLASELSHEGYDVTMLDIDEQAFYDCLILMMVFR